MSWYRDEYLKSEDWKNLRQAILIYQDYICECCGGVATDVHHLNYRKIWDVTHYDLMATCRTCHDAIHEFLKVHPEEMGKRNKHSKMMGLGVRREIAEFVSRRGYIEFRACFEHGPKKGRNARIKILSHKLKKELRRLDKIRNGVIG